MFCPSCGKPASADQKFCRSCGLNLERVPEILSDHPSAAKPGKPLMGSRLLKVVFAGFIGLFGGALLAIIGENWISDASAAVGGLMEKLGFAMYGVGLGLLVFTLFYTLWVRIRQAPASQQTVQPTARAQAQPTTQLIQEHQAEPIPSVTEHTTERLEAPQAQVSARDVARQRE